MIWSRVSAAARRYSLGRQTDPSPLVELADASDAPFPFLVGLVGIGSRQEVCVLGGFFEQARNSARKLVLRLVKVHLPFACSLWASRQPSKMHITAGRSSLGRGRRGAHPRIESRGHIAETKNQLRALKPTSENVELVRK